jgi:hypothetical protein
MKIANLFESVKDNTLLGQTVLDGTLDREITENTPKEKWKKEFNCSHMGLKTLKYSPAEVKGDFDCSHNMLTSFEGISPIIHGNLWIGGNPIKSFKDIHKHIKKVGGTVFLGRHIDIKSHILGLVLIDGSFTIVTAAGSPEFTKALAIISKYTKILKKTKADLIECQNELIDAGLEDYAQL